MYITHTSDYVTSFNSCLVFLVAGCRNISNTLSIGTKIDRSSAELKEVAQKHGLWDGQVSATRSFKTVIINKSMCHYLSFPLPSEATV
jgi:hypothetical protein